MGCSLKVYRAGSGRSSGSNGTDVLPALYVKSMLTDWSKWIRRIASASKGAADNTVNLGMGGPGGGGIVLVTTISWISSRANRSRAGPAITAWVAQTYTWGRAPWRITASTAPEIVRAVEMMSSIMTGVRPSTSPTTCTVSLASRPTRRWNTMAK